MDRPDLPSPKTPGDRYLYDIATSLRTLVDQGGGVVNVYNDRRPEPPQVELREPKASVLDDMTRDELDDHARTVGVKEPEKLPNKAAVKRAIRERS